MPTPTARRILIASDHAGVELKAAIQQAIPDRQWVDIGPVIEDRVDYPDFAEKVATEVAKGNPPQGVLICGSGIGMCIAANKIPGIRAAVVESVATAKLSREHNDANILCIGARTLPSVQHAIDIVKAWLETPFTAEGRHQERIRKISALESKRK